MQDKNIQYKRKNTPFTIDSLNALEESKHYNSLKIKKVKMYIMITYCQDSSVVLFYRSMLAMLF